MYVYIIYRHASNAPHVFAKRCHQWIIKSLEYLSFRLHIYKKKNIYIWCLCRIPSGTTSFINLAGEHLAACVVVCCICVILLAGGACTAIFKNTGAESCWITLSHTMPGYATLLWKTKTRSFHQTPLWSFWSRRPPAAPRMSPKIKKCSQQLPLNSSEPSQTLPALLATKKAE